MKQEPQICQEHGDRRSPPLLGSPGRCSTCVVWAFGQPPCSSASPGAWGCLLHISCGCCSQGRPASKAPSQGLFLPAPDIGHSPPWQLWALVPDQHFDLIRPFGLFSDILMSKPPLVSTRSSAARPLLSRDCRLSSSFSSFSNLISSMRPLSPWDYANGHFPQSLSLPHSFNFLHGPIINCKYLVHLFAFLLTISRM